MNFKLDPIKQFALFLTVFTTGAVVYNWSADVLLHLAATVGFGLVLYTFYTWISSKHKNVWDTVITAEIIFLLLHYGTGLSALAYPIAAVFIAETIKFFIEWKNSPIVNPAVAGLLLTAAAAALMGWNLPFVSWWGASYWSLPYGFSVSFVLIGLWIAIGFNVWRKWAILVSFLVTMFVLLPAIDILQGVNSEVLKSVTFNDFASYSARMLWDFRDLPLNSTIYFLGSIMLPEPKTSPFQPSKQIVYGVLAAGLCALLTYFYVPYGLLFGIIGANLFNAGLKWKSQKRLVAAK